jgi:hypothetical protein
MQTIKQDDQPEDQTKDEKGSPSSEEPNRSKAETKQIKQSGKAPVKKKAARKKAAKTAGGRKDTAKKKASPTRRKKIQNEESNGSKAEAKQIKQSGKAPVKKKAARKKAAKTAGGHMDTAKTKASPTSRKEAQPERPSGPGQAASVTGSKAGKVKPAEQNQPEKSAEGSVSPAAAAPHSQPPPQAGTGLMGFWIKAGAAAFVVLAGVIGIYSFFSEDEATSRPEATQAAARALDDGAPVADSVIADTGTFAGAAPANESVVETAITAGLTPGVTPAADQPLAGQSDAAPPTLHSGRFTEEPARYRPELYRPLEPEQDPLPPTQPGAANETPRASFVPAPNYYPQPGAYAYPPAPYYGGYGGRYYPY